MSKVLQNAVKTEAGVEVNGILVQPVVENCSGCDRVCEFEGQQFCSSYPMPAKKWASGKCNFATHIKVEVAAKAKVNPLKASKPSKLMILVGFVFLAGVMSVGWVLFGKGLWSSLKQSIHSEEKSRT